MFFCNDQGEASPQFLFQDMCLEGRVAHSICEDRNYAKRDCNSKGRVISVDNFRTIAFEKVFRDTLKGVD